MSQNNFIVNRYFIVGIFVLILNDIYLKYEYHNFITGKLSDFTGLFIFPLFLATLFPSIRKYASGITGVAFILWKLPLSTPILEYLNNSLSIKIHREIDYSDYIALIILPMSHYLINSKNNYLRSINHHSSYILSIAKYSLLATAFIAFSSTSMVIHEIPKGTIYIGKSYNIKLPKDSIIKAINDLGYDCTYFERDSSKRLSDYYQTNNIIRYHDDTTIIDTIQNIKYRLIELKPNKTKLTIINVTISEDGNIQNWRTLKKLSNLYSKWLNKNIIEKID